MPGKRKTPKNAALGACMPGPFCCKVEAVVPVDERGQMVLPKDLRQRAGIGAGAKLAIMAWEREGEIVGLFCVKADCMTGYLRQFFGPLMDGPQGTK